jgi:Zn finger protein HypA/HybF involved in hydrogenase expression
MMIAVIECSNCSYSGKTEWLDSIPYCPVCGKPMTDDEIKSSGEIK